MARPLRIEYKGALYHITSRGNARQEIFISKEDYKGFLELLDDLNERYNWVCYAYCLMPNHYHLLVETPDGNLSIGMRHLNGVYTQMFNRNHNRVGHVFQGRFKSIIVQKENYLLELCRYIVLNPVRTCMVKHPKDWEWSSYSATTGIIEKPRFLKSRWTVSQFGDKRDNAVREYAKFVLEGLEMDSPLKLAVKGIFLGGAGFQYKYRKVLKSKRDVKEIVRKERFSSRPELEKIFIKSMPAYKSGALFYKAYMRYGYTFSEISKYLNIHYSMVSKTLKKYVLKH